MCGIVAYLGPKNPLPIVLNGLQRLEYRGYDSAGIFLSDGLTRQTTKVVGKVSELRNELATKNKFDAQLGMGHTRWATHGEPNQLNAHPHVSNSGDLVLIHNGIIENYGVLKKELIERGYHFTSETDSEVLVNWIEEIKKTSGVKLGKAVQMALSQVVGAYGIVVHDNSNPMELIVARLGSPIAIGLEKEGFFVGSDATPFLDHTREVIYLEDNEMAILRAGKDIQVRQTDNDTLRTPTVEELKWNLENIQKGGFPHFMLKEIHEQPDAIRNTLRGRLFAEEGKIQISSFNEHQSVFTQARRIIIIACGTSWHAGLVGEYLIETFARIPVEVEYASEFRYRNPLIYSDDIVIPISQSGETADTLAALKLAKKAGAFIYGICNVVGSSISRETHSGMYTHAGPEIGVASTKAFTTQIAVLSLIAFKLAVIKETLSPKALRSHLIELDKVPTLMEQLIAEKEQVEEIAKIIHTATNCLYLGRGYNFPVALEGALKLKEISYIHAEGYPAAEMKHGPIALIDEAMPVVVIATRKGHYEKIVSNIQEIKSRKGIVIAIVSKGDTSVKKIADYCIEIPESSECFTPLYATLPLQFLSYYIAVLRECNVDQPRNLAKSVTVE
ncbi:MAG TPA: glutamine--fructose-6-phosphate transaminase (isomerizing) [Flavobacteriaceae bacterium]|nr:glutamine--fructose-6-phosphate transaminase (isomerizing) [Flavobacteriaceae bacterium]|tara:strand:- start:35520 stop:37367 length:1848 start_codon:yes stop_codon:yes gene_type:complete